jgi:hypothetical protein
VYAGLTQLMGGVAANRTFVPQYLPGLDVKLQSRADAAPRRFFGLCAL